MRCTADSRMPSCAAQPNVPRQRVSHWAWQQERARSNTSYALLQGSDGDGLHDRLRRLGLHDDDLAEHLLLPAFVAGFRRVLIMQTPGMITFPVFFTSLLARAARLSSTFEHSDFFSSVEAAIASQRAPLLRALAPAFIAFMAFIALGAISIENAGWVRKLRRP